MFIVLSVVTLVVTSGPGQSFNIAITHGNAHMGMAKSWNSIQNNSAECCSDVGLNHTCHHCENGMSKINGLCLLIRLKQKRKFL